jgi:hypothetical protein
MIIANDTADKWRCISSSVQYWYWVLSEHRGWYHVPGLRFGIDTCTEIVLSSPCLSLQVCFTESHTSENGVTVYDTGCASSQVYDMCLLLVVLQNKMRWLLCKKKRRKKIWCILLLIPMIWPLYRVNYCLLGISFYQDS